MTTAKNKEEMGDGVRIIEQYLFCMLFGTSDKKESMAAFIGKRKPEFTGN